MEHQRSYPYSNQSSSATKNEENKNSGGYTSLSVPQISLPKSGGAIRSIDEKFSVNAVNGTAGLTIPFPFSPSRNGFMPQMGPVSYTHLTLPTKRIV